MHPDLLNVLVCPETRLPLRLIGPVPLAGIQGKIAGSELLNRGGQPVRGPIDNVLLREDGRCGFVIKDGIPILLMEEALDFAEPLE